MSFSPSPYQQRIFDFVSTGNGSAIVEAVAGSGKTTTIVQAVRLIPKDKSVLMLAFNKTIAEELNSRIALPNVQVKTFHSLGYSAYRDVHGSKVKMDNAKLFRLIDDLVENSNLTDEERKGAPHINKVVKLGKSMGIGTQILDNLPENWMALIEHHDIGGFDDEVDLRPIIPICQEILRRSNNMTSIIDFDDMIYLPVQQGLSFRKFDWVFVDESQDVSHTQRLMLRGLMKKTSRMIAVGDPCQAIYGFRGADSTALDGIRNDFGCVTLPLSISYRCPRSVVIEAQKHVTHIEASPTAEEGTVSRMDKYSEADFNPGDAVLCRNIAPLVKFAYGLISRGIPANMIGRDIGSGLVKLIRILKAKDVDELGTKLSAWQDAEIMKLSAGKNNEQKIESISDRAECLQIFIEQGTGLTIGALISKIESFFSEDPNGNITLCSVHRGKGKEWDTVFILDESRFMPKWAKRDWMKIQERNIVYVAVTRAKKNLNFIVSGNWKDK